MDKYEFEDVGTLDEWVAICKRWNKPKIKPQRHVSSLSHLDLRHKVICIYKLQRDLAERDIGLVKPAGSSTPVPNSFWWVYGINSLLK